MFSLVCLVLFSACDAKDVTAPEVEPVDWEELKITAKVAKWHDGKSAAVSLTYDAPWHSDPLIVQAGKDAIERGLSMSYEFVTASYTDYPELIRTMQEELLPLGIGFYGHGHEHENFDDQDYNYSYESFLKCYDYMKSWGLNPKGYAYPHGKGFESTTRLANMNAGFICARGLTFLSNDNFICADDRKEPYTWFYLPSISVASDIDGYVNDHGMMSDVFAENLEREAWIIIMYHSLGFPDSWGYYPYDDYLADINEIAESDVWCATMSDVACYVKERNMFIFADKAVEQSERYVDYMITLWDGLDNDVFDQPLTVDLSFDFPDSIRHVEFDLPNYENDSFEVSANSLRLELLPDEKKHLLRLYLDKQ